MTDKVINFRIDEATKTAFEMVAKNLDLTSSQMLRAYMREAVENYMKNNAQQSLLEKRPERANKAAKQKNIKQKSVIPDSWRHK
jgi:antitoxin component of RelBE/YafQ-DinJ toxin-antitoxin module